jgi:hypothetical protein
MDAYRSSLSLYPELAEGTHWNSLKFGACYDLMLACSAPKPRYVPLPAAPNPTGYQPSFLTHLHQLLTHL